MPVLGTDHRLDTWIENDGQAADPPRDALEWVAIAKRLGRDVRTVFVSEGRGRWRVAVADRSAIHFVGGQDQPSGPLDVRKEVTAALRAAGKPVVD